MSGYSPQAQELLARWNCLSANMRSVIARARYLQRKARSMGPGTVRDLERQLNDADVGMMYRQIGLEMRKLSATEGVEKEFPEAGEFQGEFMVGRFVDFHISEEAIPGMLGQIDLVNGKVLQLLATLCFVIRLRLEPPADID